MEKFDVQSLVDLNNNLVAAITALTNISKLLNTAHSQLVSDVSKALEHIQKLEDENARLDDELNNAKMAMGNFKNDD